MADPADDFDDALDKLNELPGRQILRPRRAHVLGEWRGNLDDDCTLERYGMLAHVEQMDRGIWWFAIYRDREDLFNFSEKFSPIRLTTGKMARAAAECCMEVLARERGSLKEAHARPGGS